MSIASRRCRCSCSSRLVTLRDVRAIDVAVGNSASRTDLLALIYAANDRMTTFNVVRLCTLPFHVVTSIPRRTRQCPGGLPRPSRGYARLAVGRWRRATAAARSGAARCPIRPLQVYARTSARSLAQCSRTKLHLTAATAAAAAASVDDSIR